MLHFAVDIMGSDTAPVKLFSGVLKAAEFYHEQCQFTVIATAPVIEECKKIHTHFTSIQFLEAKEEIKMEDAPLLAVRRKQESSMALAMQLVRDKKCDGLVTAGNTGAITAHASLELEKLPGISRPALLALLPTEKGKVAILDVGANVTFRPKYLMQFALMGSAYQKIVEGVENPKVGLLNIGGEARKGTRIVQQAYEYFNHYDERLEENKIHFEGNVEGRDVFEGKVDVLVTDGFTGNIFLKTCEGVASFIVDQISKRFAKLPLFMPKKALGEVEKYLDYSEYPGATLIGVEGVIVKCHGCSSPEALENGIKGAFMLAKNQIIDKMREHLKEYTSDLASVNSL